MRGYIEGEEAAKAQIKVKKFYGKIKKKTVEASEEKKYLADTRVDSVEAVPPLTKEIIHKIFPEE